MTRILGCLACLCFLAPAQELKYAGSAACKTCHPAIFQRWTKTRMANVVRDPREHPEQRRRIGLQHEPNHDRDAERQAEKAENASHLVGRGITVRRRPLTRSGRPGRDGTK